jgi:hypothetical protein
LVDLRTCAKNHKNFLISCSGRLALLLHLHLQLSLTVLASLHLAGILYSTFSDIILLMFGLSRFPPFSLFYLCLVFVFFPFLSPGKKRAPGMRTRHAQSQKRIGRDIRDGSLAGGPLLVPGLWRSLPRDGDGRPGSHCGPSLNGDVSDVAPFAAVSPFMRGGEEAEACGAAILRSGGRGGVTDETLGRVDMAGYDR